jgi:hypothetical protein
MKQTNLPRLLFLYPQKKYIRYILLLPLFIVFMTGCKKDIKQEEISIGEQVKSGPIPPYLFDWETSTYMPSPTPGNQVQMPWNSGTTAIDPNIVSDYKKVDGWEMVWNTFSPTTTLNDPSYTYFFALYNKYRGILRFYLWQSASGIATSYINHGLSLYTTSTTSPMLNFNAKDLVDPTTNQTAFSQVLNQQVNASGGTWFAFQYEVAYDPNISNTSFPNFGLTWNPRWASVSSITLNGTQTGTIAGYLGNPDAPGFNFGSLLTQGTVTLFGGLNYSQMLGILDGANQPPPYATALTNALGGIVKGYMNAVLGGGSSGAQPINLVMNTKINLSGSLVTNGGLTNMKLVMPGQANSQTADGNTPAYNNIMGLFNVVGKPQIRIGQDYWYYWTTEPNDGVTPCMEAGYNVQLWFDDNSINFIWNPAIINSSPTGATIQNMHKQVLVFTDYNSEEKINGQWVEVHRDPTISNPGLTGYTVQYCSSEGKSPYTPDLAVRVIFDVVPNNGAPKSTIVKTFMSNQLY